MKFRMQQLDHFSEIGISEVMCQLTPELISVITNTVDNKRLEKQSNFVLFRAIIPLARSKTTKV